jgi:hypothetical protein
MAAAVCARGISSAKAAAQIATHPIAIPVFGYCMHKPHVMPDPMAILRQKFHLMEAVHQKKALRKEGFPGHRIAYGVCFSTPHIS